MKKTAEEKKIYKRMIDRKMRKVIKKNTVAIKYGVTLCMYIKRCTYFCSSDNY